METLIRRLVEGGLERVGRPVVAEIEEVARTAHHGRLVRVERELTGLATVAGRYLDRDPGFRPDGWVAVCNRVELLLEAARQAEDAEDGRVDEVLGVYRRTYERIDGTLVVHALAASGWVSDSGFVGITVHLWDGRRMLQATQARPIALLGRDPRRLLFQPISEVTPLTVHELSHGSWVLDDLRISHDGRLSLHTGLQATAAAPIGRRAYEAHACDGVEAILDRLAADELAPLGGAGAVLAFVDVASVKVHGIDETRAIAAASIGLPSGGSLRVHLSLRPENDLLLDNLVRLELTPPVGMFGRAWVAGGELRFDPYTAVFESPVRLDFRRSGQVLEAHLGLEPLPGEVKVPKRERANNPRPARSGLDAPLANVAGAVESMFATGLALPDPEIAGELRQLAARWEAAEGVSGLMRTLAAALDAIRDGDRGRLDEAHRALHQLAAWVRLFRAGAALRAARTSEAPVTAARRGEDLVVVPLGAELSAHRVLIYGVRENDGSPVVLEDELRGIDPDDPFGSEAPSRLFQAPIRLGDVLRRAVVLTDHPVARGAGRWVVRPAFHSAATHGAAVPEGILPTVASPIRGMPFRIGAWSKRTPEGWQLVVPGTDPVPVTESLLQLDLEKRGPGSIELIAVLRRETLVVLQIDRTFPTLDPRATLWRRQDLVARADPQTARLLTGAPPPDGGLEASGERLTAEIDAVRREIAGGGVVPTGWELWTLGRAACRLAGRDPDDRPVLELGLPISRLRLAAAGPIGRWLRSSDPPDDAVRDALVLVHGAGLEDVLFR